jgi:hypothetical protein
MPQGVSDKEEIMIHDRDEVIRHIHRLAHAVACGQAPFPQSRETILAVNLMLKDAGLKKAVALHTYSDTKPGLGDLVLLAAVGHTFSYTEPGLDGLLMLAGINCPWEIPFAFDVSDEDLDRLEFAPTEAETLEVLRAMAIELYAKHFQAGGRH